MPTFNANLFGLFFVKLGASSKYKLDSSLIFSSRTKSVSFLHENFHLSFKNKIMKYKNRLKIIIITQPCEWVDWLHMRFVDQNFCSVSIMMHDGIFAQFATFIQSITSFNSVIINESSYCASRRRYAQTSWCRRRGGGGSVRRLISLTGGHSMKTGLIILFMTPTPPLGI